MKPITLLLTISLLFACRGKNELSEKVKQLNELKAQQSEIRDRIAALEAELKSADTSGGGNPEGKLVALTKLSPDTFNHFIELQGRVEGDQDVTISAETMGTIIAVNVKPGDKVSKGQILARLDDRIIRQGYDEVKSQLELANQVFQRQQNLWQQRIGSEIQFLQAKTSKEALEKRLAGIQEQMGMSLIKAPISGTVDQVFIKTGQSIAPGIPAMRVVNLQALKVTAEVAESYITSIKTGNEVILGFPDIKKEIKTRLTYAGKSINRLNRTFNVEIHLDDNNGEFRPNMMTEIKIVDYHNNKALVIPVASIQKSGEGEFVYVASKTGKLEQAKRKKITSGQTYNGMAEITAGLSEGDEVITTGYQSIMDGDIIRR